MQSVQSTTHHVLCETANYGLLIFIPASVKYGSQ